MKKIIVVIFGLLILLGCTQVQNAQNEHDEFIQLKGVDETFAPTVYSTTDGGNLMLELKSSYYEKVEILEENTTIAVKRCTMSKEEALLGAFTGDKSSCSNLTCSVTNVAQAGKQVYVNATCTSPVAEKGKTYLVDLGLKAKMPKDSLMIIAFPLCSTADAEFDICEVTYKMAFQKR